MLIIALSAFLVGAVVYDLVSHRLPNCYLLLGFMAALFLQVWAAGWAGLMAWGGGMLVGLVLFLPFYALGGMAAGDVKLMAVVGSFLGVKSALWACAYSMMAGGIIGVFYLVLNGDFIRLVARYWAMASLRARIPAGDDDSARHRFPYAIAIAVGALLSLYWTPI